MDVNKRAATEICQHGGVVAGPAVLSVFTDWDLVLDRHGEVVTGRKPSRPTVRVQVDAFSQPMTCHLSPDDARSLAHALLEAAGLLPSDQGTEEEDTAAPGTTTEKEKN